MSGYYKKETWIWVLPEAISFLHQKQLEQHGGLDGVRDQGALESALARPEMLAHYGTPDAAALAAAYAHGIARNHGFIDGNKRTAWLSANVFLEKNGYALDTNESEAIRTMQALAAGEVSEDAFAQWLRKRIQRIG